MSAIKNQNHHLGYTCFSLICEEDTIEGETKISGHWETYMPNMWTDQVAESAMRYHFCCLFIYSYSPAVSIPAHC